MDPMEWNGFRQILQSELQDSHDDNIMLRKDGFLFRVDFGFLALRIR